MTETVYHVPGAPRTAVLSDFHNGDATRVLERVCQRVPELICLPGDVVVGVIPKTGLVVESERNVLPFLRGCVAIAPTFMSLGNHESVLCEEDIAAIHAAGVNVLDNAWVSFDGLNIGGLTSPRVLDRRAYLAAHPSAELYPKRRRGPWTRIRTPELAWLAAPPEGFRLLMCHHPELFPQLPDGIGLTCAGHAHGGQWRAFGRGVYAPDQGLFPTYTSGVHRLGGNCMVISRGLTNTYPIPRLNNPTEIVFLEP